MGVWCFSCADSVVGVLLPVGLMFVTFVAGFVLYWLLDVGYCGLGFIVVC